MNRIESIFNASRESGHKVLMPLVCGGCPTLDDMPQTLPALSGAGAGIIEVGLPFSDPIADGPVIAEAMRGALQAGVTARSVIDAVAAVRPTLSAGLVASASVSIVEQIGRDRFIGVLADAGFDGVIYPDASLEEARALIRAASGRGLCASMLIPASTPLDLAAQICDQCTGFVYVLGPAGATGTQGGGRGTAVRERIRALQGVTDLPLAVGFGIGSADDVEAVVSPDGGDADAAIVGSALVQRMIEAGPGRAAGAAESFCRELATGLGGSW